MADAGSWGLFLACAFFAEVVGTLAGFGAATILTPIAALFMDIKTAIATVTCFHLFGNVFRLRFFGRQIDWRIVRLFGISGILCSLLGATVTAALPSAMIKLAFGVFLLAYVAFSIWAGDRVRLPARAGTLIGGGIASGFIAGLLGTGGAVRSACLMAFQLPKEAYLGTSAILALFVDGTRLPIYIVERFIASSMTPVVASLVVVAFAGAWVGQRIVKRVSARAFHRFVMVMLALMGLKMVWDGWRGIS